MTDNPPPSGATSPSGQAQEITITPELVRKLAEKVYCLLLAEIKTERERRRNFQEQTSATQGGRNVI